MTDGETPIPSEDAVRTAQTLYDEILKYFPRAAADFESRWSSWHALCESKASTNDDGKIDPCTDSAEYAAIKRLGPKIIPMLVQKLAIDPIQNWPAVYLYKALENDPLYQVAMEGSICSSDMTRQLADSIVQTNYDRYKIYESRLRAYVSLCEQNSILSSYRSSTISKEFDDLLDMGTSILAYIMVDSYKNSNGWWWELMHEIVHGRKTYALQFQPEELDNAWEKWFNEGEHEQAPEYILSDLERRVYGPNGPDIIPPYRREDRR